jgi:hypothetical protein
MGGGGVSANEYSCTYGARINVGDLPPCLTRVQQPTEFTLAAQPKSSLQLLVAKSTDLGSITQLVPAACLQPKAPSPLSPLLSAANSTHLGSTAPLLPAAVSSQQQSPWQHRHTHPRCCQQPTALTLAAPPHSSPLLSAANSTHLGSTATLIPAAVSSQQHSPWRHRPTHPRCCQHPSRTSSSCLQVLSSWGSVKNLTKFNN